MKSGWWLGVFSWSLLLAVPLGAQEQEFLPGARYTESIPTLEEVLGHAWGEKITSPEQALLYLRALERSSPRIQLREMGESWEGRPLVYAVISGEQHLGNLASIQQNLKRLADPRTLPESQAEELIASLPVVVWLAYGVHGNEISSTDAALLTAYHLLASVEDPVAENILENVILIIDPVQNPDGRQRFISYFEQTRGRWPDPDPQAAEHNEPWPSGRTNHYLFDMNRDWFALTQPETRARVGAYLQWFPQVFVDLHEMGANSTYYFAPPALPHNPHLTSTQHEWLRRFGENNGRWFDRMGFDYFTREVFDSFYPGYGEGWPMFHGSIGMTYEQASADGLVIRREDETLLHYRDGVQHHFISSLSTAQTAAENRRELLRSFYQFRKSAVQEGSQAVEREFILPPGSDPQRVAKLVSVLISQGIEVRQARSEFRNGKVRDLLGEELQARSFPAGTYVVRLDQPAMRLARTLLSRHVPMDEEFIREQIRRYQKRMSDEIYDVTAWSLPLLYDVSCYIAEEVSAGELTVLEAPPQPEGEVEGPAGVAYLIPWNSNAAAQALAQLLQEGIRVFTADRSFRQGSRSYPPGTLIIKRADNPSDLHERLQAVARRTGVRIHATDTSWVEEGINFGSNQVQFIKAPKIAMAYDAPTNPGSVGAARYLLERVYSYPVTVIKTSQLSRADLGKYNVLILPNASSFSGGGYSRFLGEEGARRIKRWVQEGGTLITIGEATRWLTEKGVEMLATSREYRSGKPESQEQESESSPEEEESAPSSLPLEEAIQPEKELPGFTPGVLARVHLDQEHWLAFGYGAGTNVLIQSRNIFKPLKLDAGRNVAVYAPERELILSGFTWEDARRQLAQKAYLMHQPWGRGHVVAFAEEPNFRAYMDGLNLLFLNAVFFGPAH